MSVINEITLVDPRREEYTNNIARIKRDMDSYSQGIADTENSIINDTKQAEAFTTLRGVLKEIELPDEQTKDVLRELISYTSSKERAFKVGCEQKNHRIQTYTTLRQRRARELAEYQQLLERTQNSDKIIKLPDVKQALKPLPNVKNKNVSFGTKNGKQYLRFSYTGITCTPNSNKFININGGEEVSFSLRDISVYVYPAQNKIVCLPKRGETSLAPIGYADGHRVHPHIIDSNEPCLGDFGSALFEALDEQDFETFATVFQLFLESADANDAAGRTWPRFLLHKDINQVHQYESQCFEIPPPLRTQYKAYTIPREIYVYAKYLGLNHRVSEPKAHYDVPIFLGDKLICPSFIGTVEEIIEKLVSVGVFKAIPASANFQLSGNTPLTSADVREPSDITSSFSVRDQRTIGYNEYGYDDNGYNADGYNRDGYDSDGYNRDGYDANGYDRYGYDSEGYNEDGFDIDGIDRDGYDDDGYDEDGFDRNGYNREGLHRLDL